VVFSSLLRLSQQSRREEEKSGMVGARYHAFFLVTHTRDYLRHMQCLSRSPLPPPFPLLIKERLWEVPPVGERSGKGRSLPKRYGRQIKWSRGSSDGGAGAPVAWTRRQLERTVDSSPRQLVGT